MPKHAIMPESYENIRTGIVELLKAARVAAVRNVNSIMAATYWEIGRRIVESEQGGERRAGHGEQIIEQLATDLSQQFGRGFGRANLWQITLRGQRHKFSRHRLENPQLAVLSTT